MATQDTEHSTSPRTDTTTDYPVYTTTTQDTEHSTSPRPDTTTDYPVYTTTTQDTEHSTSPSPGTTIDYPVFNQLRNALTNRLNKPGQVTVEDTASGTSLNVMSSNNE